jgi:hypothetical protein
MIGRRRPDQDHVGDLPEDIQPGDYWKILGLTSEFESNLTGTCWYVVAPETGFGVAMLRAHTIREEGDGTISVRPGDGSSNSILVTGAHGKTWHGYIEHGDWRPA